MKKTLLLIALSAVVAAVPAQAQDWSIGGGTGAFVFGKFIERTLRTTNGDGETTRDRVALSARTRPGLVVDIEHDFTSWLGVRAEGTFTHAPLAVKTVGDNSGVALETGTVNVTTLAIPFVIHFNRHGAFRFNLKAGPAYAIYDFKQHAAPAGTLTVSPGSRNRWGATAGAGLDWYLSDRFAVEGQIADIVTSSPLQRSDFTASFTTVDIPRPHNVHTTVGLRYRF